MAAVGIVLRFEPVAFLGRVLTCEDSQEAFGGDFAGLAKLAADGDFHVAAAAFGQSVNLLGLRRSLFLELFEFLGPSIELRLFIRIWLAFLLLDPVLLLVQSVLKVLDRILSFVECLDFLCRTYHLLVDARVVENSGQRVIVLLRDRIELVVVAARALEGHAQQAARGGDGAVEDVLEPELLVDHAALAGKMAAPGYYRDPANDTAADNARLESLEARTLAAYEEWENLSERTP